MKHATVGAIALLLATACAAEAALPGLDEYTGSEGCRSCHRQKYEEWRSTLHSSVVQDPKVSPLAILGDFSQPGIGFRVEDVAFTVGGHWSQRYVTRIDGRFYTLPKVWSVASHGWEDRDTRSWRKRPYDVYCIGCHATRYDPESGTFVEHEVGCEACHGPGQRHADSNGQASILNPSHLPQDEQDLLCASCHVRGTDPTERFYFAVGYVPGGPLEDRYLPLRRLDGEAPREALLRTYREWRERLSRAQPPSCDVCGITRPVGGDPAPQQECQACHRFEDRPAPHTNHPRSVELHCLDCHRKVDLPRWTPADVHSPEYFRVHRQTTYAVNVSTACLSCHPDFTPDAVDLTLRTWDHSHHPQPQ